MRRFLATMMWACLSAAWLAWGASAAWADAPTELCLETGDAAGPVIHLAGRDAGWQLVVSGRSPDGQQRDVTGEVRYTVDAEAVARVSETGYVTPLGEGEATIHVQHPAGPDATLAVRVTHLVQDLPVNFPNAIVPVFSKHGCNSGGCHGKSGGQNGFRLSLFGFEPAEDYEYLVKEGRSRRLFPAAPDRSLLLLKATGQLPHGGGERIVVDSPAYRLLRRWIEQGMPYGNDTDPTVTRIEVLPGPQRMGRHQTQQLSVLAHYTDGSLRDVTRMTQFDSNDAEMAEVDILGRVTTGEFAGSAAIMARYQGHVDVFRATIPLGRQIPELPAAANVVDEYVFDKLRELGLPPSPVCDDATFLRRVTIDLAGRLPTLDELDAFQALAAAQRRSEVVERLLAGVDYADYFANKWAAILRNKRNSDTDRYATYALHDWIRSGLLHNLPYDEFVRELLTASGDPSSNPPAAWYREVRVPSAQVEDTAQLFLGLRIQCARCHHHPFEKWSQQDYYGFQAFFARVGRKRGRLGQERIFHNPGLAQAQNPKTKENVRPTGLGGAALEIDALDDPRQALADWLVAADNPFFARALVNRYWKHFFGRGLVEPEDDMRITNPATHPKLLEALAQDFIASGFDLKQLVRVICNSHSYQLRSEPNEWNRDDKQNFSRFYPRRLQAEVLLDAVNQVTGTRTDFGTVPAGTRAVALPDSGFGSYFLSVFGKPESNSACECERSSEANLAQSLHLLNSAEMLGKLTDEAGRAARLAGDDQTPLPDKVRRLYRLALAREPEAEEMAVAVAHLEKSGHARQAYEDLVWVLINTKEFLFNH